MICGGNVLRPDAHGGKQLRRTALTPQDVTNLFGRLNL
jgi:hypothetical protein